MQGDLHDYMAVGIVQFMAYPQTMGGSGPIVESVQAIADDPFFGAIEVGQMPEASTRRQVRDILKAKNFQVGFGCQPIELANKLDINSLDESVRKSSVARIIEGIDMAVDIGATRCAVLSGPDPGADKRAAATDALVASLDELLSYAESKGINSFALETFDQLVDKKSLIGSNADAAKLSARVRVKHPGFGLMLDLSHFPLQFETIEQGLEAGKDHLIHIHIGNAVLEPGHKLYGDLHPHFECQGGANGVYELYGFLKKLLQIGYIGEGKKNIVAYEVRPHGVHEWDNSVGVIKQSQEVLRRAWEML